MFSGWSRHITRLAQLVFLFGKIWDSSGPLVHFILVVRKEFYTAFILLSCSVHCWIKTKTNFISAPSQTVCFHRLVSQQLNFCDHCYLNCTLKMSLTLVKWLKLICIKKWQISEGLSCIPMLQKIYSTLKFACKVSLLRIVAIFRIHSWSSLKKLYQKSEF